MVKLLGEDESHHWCQDVAGLLIRERKARHWSQEKLGEHMGISQSLVANMEHNPDVVTAKRLHAALHTLDLELVVRPRGTADELAITLPPEEDHEPS